MGVRFLLALCVALAVVSSAAALPGVRSLMLMPASVYVNGTEDQWVDINFNITYFAWDGVNLANFSVSFENALSAWTSTNCTNKDLLPNGWTPTFSTDNTTLYFANQTCSFMIGKDTPVGLWELANITLLSGNGTSFQPFGIPLMSIINVQMDTPLCLPPTIYVSRTSPDVRISLTDFPEQPNLALLDDGDVTVNMTVGFKAPQGLNVSLTQFSFRQRGVDNNSVILTTGPCGDPSDPALFNGTVTCGLIVPNSTTEWVYELTQIRLVDTKGTEWNSDRLDLLRAINADLNDQHLAHHVNPEHGSVYHSHLCGYPILTVVNELNSCNPSRFVKCLMTPMECDNTTNPACPNSNDCRLRYRFARCAVQYYCLDALSVWCNGGFFNQSGCGTATDAAPIWQMCQKAVLSNCRPEALSDCSTKAVPANATSCRQRKAFNSCVVASNCPALIRNVADCTSNDTPVIPGPPMSLHEEMLEAYHTSFVDPEKAARMFDNLAPRLNQSKSSSAIVAICVAVAVVAIVGVAVIMRRRRSAPTATFDQELL